MKGLVPRYHGRYHWYHGTQQDMFVHWSRSVPTGSMNTHKSFHLQAGRSSRARVEEGKASPRMISEAFLQVFILISGRENDTFTPTQVLSRPGIYDFPMVSRLFGFQKKDPKCHLRECERRRKVGNIHFLKNFCDY